MKTCLSNEHFSFLRSKHVLWVEVRTNCIKCDVNLTCVDVYLVLIRLML